MTMMRKTITIPDAMESWIKIRIQSGHYANDSEYVRDLIRRDQERHTAETQLRDIMQESLQSGTSDSASADIKARVENRLKADGRL
ncbi:type II toxin-antitoxin system ParD family antitoxin [Maricaulis sp.]|uniref:type II toxin-antitoxin system ParD family antitoxin n=1 Tax=Maricaulis sp. TaxID=1486257 RepID=UPI003A92F649|tara:strand:+ start:1132 stop:1389 length:258 start_codon:yes stop_codon:yes gene_type:complete